MSRSGLVLLWLAGAAAQGASVFYQPLSFVGEAGNGVFAEDLDGDGVRDLIAFGRGRVSIYRGQSGDVRRYGSSELRVKDIYNWPAFCATLARAGQAGARSAGKRVWELLPADVQPLVRAAAQGQPDEARQARIIEALNRVLQRRDFYRQDDYRDVTLSAEANVLLGLERGAMLDHDVQRLSRLLLEAAYPHDIARSPTPEIISTRSLAYFADVADVLPAPGREVVVLTAKGISCYVQKDGAYESEPQELVRCNTLLSLPILQGAIENLVFHNVEVLPWNFAFDADGDGRDDVLVPHDRGTDIYLQKSPGEFAKPITLLLFPLIGHRLLEGGKANGLGTHEALPVRVEIAAAPLERRDVNGDGKLDLVCGDQWFAQKFAGGFDPTPATVPGGQPIRHRQLVDINADGRFDRIVEDNNTQDPFNIRTYVRYFLADANGNLPPEPTDTIVDQNILVYTPLPVHDFDGDGTMDFAMFRTDITPTELAKWLRQSFGKIDGDLNLYLFDKRRNCYRETPSWSKPIKMRFRLDLQEVMIGMVWERYLGSMMRFEGDYNGDGRPDLLVRERTNAIALYLNTGDRRELFPRRPDVYLDEVPMFTGLDVDDLNGDGLSDLILSAAQGFFAPVTARADIVAVYISQRR